MQSLTTRYTREAPAYAALWAPVLQPLVRAHLDALEALDVLTVRRVLDLATGVGSALADLHLCFPSACVIGVDRSIGMLRAAPRTDPLVCMDASRLALGTQSFDFVLMAFALFHLPDPHAGLAEINRVLTPGGTLALTTWADDEESVATQVWNAALDAHGAIPSQKLEHLAQHELMDSTEKVQALLDSAGFVGVRTTQREFQHLTTADAFLQLKSKVGRNRRRLESLDARVQQECLDQARQRFASLRRDDFTLRLPVIMASASARPAIA